MNDITKKIFDSNYLQDIAKQILEEAARQGATEAEVSMAVNKGYSVTAREGAVETVAYNQDKVVEIAVLFGKKSGASSITDLRPEAIRAGVEAACHIAKFTGEE
jgi:PmbA protein